MNTLGTDVPNGTVLLEGDAAVDDIEFHLRMGGRVYVQAKRSLTLSDQPDSEFAKTVRQLAAQVSDPGYDPDRTRLVLAVGKETGPLRSLQAGLNRGRKPIAAEPNKAERDALDRFIGHAQALSPTQRQQLVQSTVVLLLELDTPESPHRRACLAELEGAVVEPGYGEQAWAQLELEIRTLAARREGGDLQHWLNVLERRRVRVVKASALSGHIGDTRAISNMASPVHYFSGRETELSTLRNAFKNAYDSHCVRVVSGFPGSGKSQLAMRLATELTGSYRVVWMISCADKAVRETGLAMFRTAKSQGGTPSFLILDDAEVSLLNDMSVFMEADHTLVLSSKGDWAASFQTINLRPLPLEDSAKLIERLVPRLSGDERQSLGSVFGGFPLALAQVGAYCARTGCSAGEYIELFVEHGGEVFDQSMSGLPHYRKIITICTLITMEQVAKASPRAMDIAGVLIFFAPTAIPLHLLRKTLADAMKTSVMKVDEAYGVLTSFSVLGLEDRCASFHGLLQKLWFEQLPQRIRPALADRFLALMARLVPDPQVAIGDESFPLLNNHIATGVAKFSAEKIAFSEANAADLLTRLGVWHLFSGRGLTGIYYQEWARDLVGERLVPVRLSIMNNLAISYKECGRPKEGEEVICQIVDLVRDNYGDSVLLGRVLDNLGQSRHAQGNFDGAEAAYRAAYRVREIYEKEDPIGLAVTLGNMGMLESSRGHTGAAIVKLENALALYKKKEDECKNWIASVLCSLAQLYEEEGRWGEAIAVGEEGAMRCADILGLTSGAAMPHIMSHFMRLMKVGGATEGIGWATSICAQFQTEEALGLLINVGATLRMENEEALAVEVLQKVRNSLCENHMTGHVYWKSVVQMLTAGGITVVGIPEHLLDSFAGWRSRS